MKIQTICDRLSELAPLELAEDWDNVGLLVGDRQAEVSRMMTCLTVTPASCDEAIERAAQLIVTHHPMPFRALKRITTDETVGRLLWKLIRAGVSVFSPHTAWDSSGCGINQQLAERFGLMGIQALVPASSPGLPGSGRYGDCPPNRSLADLLEMTKSAFQLSHVQFVGDSRKRIDRMAVACGSAGSFLQPAILAGCDALLTGETTFHTCLEAEANGVALILPGHFASERFALDMLAGQLSKDFPELTVWASEREADPVRFA